MPSTERGRRGPEPLRFLEGDIASQKPSSSRPSCLGAALEKEARYGRLGMSPKKASPPDVLGVPPVLGCPSRMPMSSKRPFKRLSFMKALRRSGEPGGPAPAIFGSEPSVLAVLAAVLPSGQRFHGI